MYRVKNVSHSPGQPSRALLLADNAEQRGGKGGAGAGGWARWNCHFGLGHKGCSTATVLEVEDSYGL